MIRVVTDSTCEAAPELMAHPAVTAVPLYVLFGQEALKDGVEITQRDFWARLPKANPLPTTSQATPNDFLEPFRRFTDAGDQVIAVTLSAKLSGTYESAVQAKAALPDRPIEVVDSLTTSVGLGLIVQEALALSEGGASLHEIATRLEQMRRGVHFLFALDTLEYLQRGGRIGKAQAFVGTLLSFKPILAVDGGEVTPVTRVRSRRKALESLVDTLGHRVTARGPQVRLGLTHAGVPDEAAEVAEKLCQHFGSSSLTVGSLGPVLGTHVGPGTIGAAAYAP